MEENQKEKRSFLQTFPFSSAAVVLLAVVYWLHAAHTDYMVSDMITHHYPVKYWPVYEYKFQGDTTTNREYFESTYSLELAKEILNNELQNDATDPLSGLDLSQGIIIEDGAKGSVVVYRNRGK